MVNMHNSLIFPCRYHLKISQHNISTWAIIHPIRYLLICLVCLVLDNTNGKQNRYDYNSVHIQCYICYTHQITPNTLYKT